MARSRVTGCQSESWSTACISQDWHQEKNFYINHGYNPFSMWCSSYIYWATHFNLLCVLSVVRTKTQIQATYLQLLYTPSEWHLQKSSQFDVLMNQAWFRQLVQKQQLQEEKWSQLKLLPEILLQNDISINFTLNILIWSAVMDYLLDFGLCCMLSWSTL